MECFRSLVRLTDRYNHWINLNYKLGFVSLFPLDLLLQRKCVFTQTCFFTTTVLWNDCNLMLFQGLLNALSFGDASCPSCAPAGAAGCQTTELHFTPRGHGRRWLLGLSHLSGLLHWRLRSRSLGICTWRTTLLVFDLTGEVKYSGLWALFLLLAIQEICDPKTSERGGIQSLRIFTENTLRTNCVTPLGSV